MTTPCGPYCGDGRHTEECLTRQLVALKARIAELEEAARWRKWPEERPEVGVAYQVKVPLLGYTHWWYLEDGWYLTPEGLGKMDQLLPTHWRPIDLPEEG